MMKSTSWPTRDEILEMACGYKPCCVLGAAAELDVFSVLAESPLSAEAAAQRLRSDVRGTSMLLDALAALRLLHKDAGRYTVPEVLQPWLVDNSPDAVLPMVRHRMNMLRGWSQLAWVVKAGIPGPRQASIRGAAADRAAFIAAMHTVSGPVADDLVARLQPPTFRQFLDVGGASGTWTLAFLRVMPGAKAVLFDLPDAISQARDRIAGTEYSDRVELVSGDFYIDTLPGGADFAWLSAIAHQHSRDHNRRLLKKIHDALLPGGWIAIRDVVMETDRTRPLNGALFGINMLVHTETGTVFTFDDLAEDLLAAGFSQPELRIKADDMNSVVLARKL
jgi:SAM-dependent methyltransferase